MLGCARDVLGFLEAFPVTSSVKGSSWWPSVIPQYSGVKKDCLDHLTCRLLLQWYSFTWRNKWDSGGCPLSKSW